MSAEPTTMPYGMLPHHAAKVFEESGISPEVAVARGYETVYSQAQLKRLGFGDGQLITPTLLHPAWGVTGDTPILYQHRPDRPRVRKGKAKAIKYETPTGARLILDVPPCVRPKLADPTIDLWITEGIRKADAGASHGLACIDLIGVWGWRGSNQWGGKAALPDWEYIALNGRQVYICFDSDVMLKSEVHLAMVRLGAFLDQRGARVAYAYLPSGPGGEKTGLDDFYVRGGTTDEMLACVSTTARRIVDDDESGPSYQRTPAGLVWVKRTGDGEVSVPLTNFDVQMTGFTIEDDGLETRSVLELEASQRGRTSRFSLTPEQFSTKEWWLEQLGPHAIVYPSARGHARVAIQSVSDDVAERVVKTYTGWATIDGAPHYLTASGAIGADGLRTDVEVNLRGGLARFELPPPPDGEPLRTAIRASLALRRVAPSRITAPIQGSVYRAVLGTCDFGIWIVGPTGVFKSELAALAQQHYGVGMDARHLPGSWSSTGNALERLAFEAKDAVFVVDDFAPTGSASDVQRYHREADRLNRAQGNNAGRARLRADGTLKAANPPRGLIFSTGEDQPRNQSARARNLIIEVSPGNVDIARLTQAQRQASSGIYAEALSGFVRWLASRHEMIAPTIAADLVQFREAAQASSAHRRTPEITAQLAIGWRWFLSFAVDAGALMVEQAARCWSDVWTDLGAAAGDQAQHQQASDPVIRYIQLLAGALANGTAHVADHKGEEPAGAKAWGWRQKEIGAGDNYRLEWQPQGRRIGWLDKDGLFLEQEAAFAAAQDMGTKTNDPLAISSRTLARRLDERGLLVSADRARKRLTTYRDLEGTRRYVLHLRADVFSAGGSYSCTSDTSDTSDTPPPSPPAVPIWSAVPESAK